MEAGGKGRDSNGMGRYANALVTSPTPKGCYSQNCDGSASRGATSGTINPPLLSDKHLIHNGVARVARILENGNIVPLDVPGSHLVQLHGAPNAPPPVIGR